MEDHVIRMEAASARSDQPRDGTEVHPIEDFSEFYRGQAPKIYAYVLRRTGNSHDAEDITSEVFLRAYRAKPKLDTRTASAWTFKVARNLVTDRLRWLRRRNPLTWVSMPGSQGSTPISDDELLLHELLGELTPMAKDAILLRVVGGFSAFEIAGILGKNPGAVKMLIHRSLERLRRRWREEVAQ